MNDRYLYRAKRIWSPNAGEWVKGTYVHTNLGREMICDGTTYIGINRPCMIDIDISTLCACTGLKDKNGKLIWENDIVCVKHTDGQEEYQENAKVSYTKRGFSPFSWEYYCDGCDVRCEILEVEVIGSAIDNPELLEVGE